MAIKRVSAPIEMPTLPSAKLYLDDMDAIASVLTGDKPEWTVSFTVVDSVGNTHQCDSLADLQSFKGTTCKSFSVNADTDAFPYHHFLKCDRNVTMLSFIGSDDAEAVLAHTRMTNILSARKLRFRTWKNADKLGPTAIVFTLAMCLVLAVAFRMGASDTIRGAILLVIFGSIFVAIGLDLLNSGSIVFFHRSNDEQSVSKYLRDNRAALIVKALWGLVGVIGGSLATLLYQRLSH